MDVQLDDIDAQIIQFFAEKGPLAMNKLAARSGAEGRSGFSCSTSGISIAGDVEKLIDGYRLLRFPQEDKVEYAAANAWIPEYIYEPRMSRQGARMTLIQKFMRCHGPVTKYEIMERYGFPDSLVERALTNLYEEGNTAKGEYVPTKSFPQWCYKSNLEEIHRLTLNRR